MNSGLMPNYPQALFSNYEHLQQPKFLGIMIEP